MADDSKSRLIEKQDLKNLAILIGIALAIGVYLIVTTVLISKDGVFYIERAQQLASDPVKIIKGHPPGYPFLILTAHKCAALFADDTSVFTWIYSAQSVTLLCRLLALIPLYFMGKLLVGSKNSFWALLILIFLPFPTKAVSDVVREWPYLLFLSMGFFFLLWSAKCKKWWAFGLVGLSCGLGYWIRPESAQLLVYGILWVVMSLVSPKLWGVSRWKALLGLVLLFVGFVMPVAPYVKCTGRIMTPKIYNAIKFITLNTSTDEVDTPKANAANSNYNTAEIVPGNVSKAFAEISKKNGETLMWFFLPALMIGLYNHFRSNANPEELYLITTFVMLNVAMIVFRYCYFQSHISQRWTLPMVTFTIFYIPIGLRVVGNWLDNKRSQCKQKTDIPRENRLSWFVILFLTGVGICIPKLLRPVGIDKQGYREVANWLNQNTDNTAVVAVPDKRIYFYAERKGLSDDKKVPSQAKYIVKIAYKDHELKDNESSVQSYYGWVNKRKKKKRIVIYEVYPKS